MSSGTDQAQARDARHTYKCNCAKLHSFHAPIGVPGKRQASVGGREDPPLVRRNCSNSEKVTV